MGRLMAHVNNLFTVYVRLGKLMKSLYIVVIPEVFIGERK